MNKENTDNPEYHVANVRNMLGDVMKHIEQDEERMDDPQALALFETSKEVLSALMRAFEHYEQGEEKAWRTPGRDRSNK